MSFPAPQVLFCALLLGAGLGLVFTFFEALRIGLAFGKAAAFFLDILLCALFAVTSFLLALAVSGGSIRLYQIVCEAIGFLCVYWTVTDAVRRSMQCVVRWWASVVQKRRRFSKTDGKKNERKKRGRMRFDRRKRAFFEIRPKKIEKNT